MLPKKVRVVGREYLRNVRGELVALLDAWEREGTHDVEVPAPQKTAAMGLPPAGAREGQAAADLQLSAYLSGASGARTLDDTPHGAGATFEAEAIDVWPVGFNPRVAWDAQPADVKAKFLAFGVFAEGRGFVWGGRWRGARFPNGDQPHVETKDWRQRRAQRKAGNVA